MGTSTRLGPTPHPGLGGGGPKAELAPSHSQAACSPAGPAGLTEPEGCRGRSCPSTELSPPTVGRHRPQHRRVWILRSALAALKPTHLLSLEERLCSKANEPPVTKSHRGDIEKLTQARSSTISNFSQFFSFPTTSPRVHPSLHD